jgi:hypothetical protein
MTFQYPLHLVVADDPYPVYRSMRDLEPAHDSAREDVCADLLRRWPRGLWRLADVVFRVVRQPAQRYP